jgi:protoporphyrinogen/coproporphyrinogen III oxidase
MPRLVVVGAGVAGLAGARAALDEARRSGVDLDLVVLEASPRAGGKLWTERVDGVTVEWGPDSFLAAKPRGRALAEELSLDLVPVGPAARRAFLLREGRLRPIPGGLVMGVPTTTGALRAAVREGLISIPGAARAWIESALPGPPIGRTDEPAARLTRRRLGDEAAARLVEPLLRGVFGAPGSQIGARSAFPLAVGHRSLVRSLRRPLESRDAPMFLGVRGGFGRLVDALVVTLPPGSLRLGTSVTAIRSDSGGVSSASRSSLGVRYEALTDTGPEPADAVLVTAPASAAAESLSTVAPDTAGALRSVPYSGSAVILLRYPPDSLTEGLPGSGFLVDPAEGLAIAACSWFSAKWPDLAGGRLVLRAVVTDPRHLAAVDDELAARVTREVGRIMGARHEPDLVRIRRWEQALPVFGPGHDDRMRSALAALPDGIALAGAFLGAVGVPDCIESGESAARRLVGRMVGRGEAQQ